MCSCIFSSSFLLAFSKAKQFIFFAIVFFLLLMNWNLLEGMVYWTVCLVRFRAKHIRYSLPIFFTAHGHEGSGITTIFLKGSGVLTKGEEDINCLSIFS